MSRGSRAGFTLIEVTFATSFLTAIMAAIFSTGRLIQGTVSTVDAKSGTEVALRQLSQKIRQYIRPLAMSTIETQAMPNDILREDNYKTSLVLEANEMMARATHPSALAQGYTGPDVLEAEAAMTTAQAYPVPAPGQWVGMVESTTERGSLRFRATTGFGPDAPLGPFTTLVFVMDPAETENDIDDDGDGLVDEGEVVWTHNGSSVVLASRVEHFTFRVDGRLAILKIRFSKIDKNGRKSEGLLSQNIYIRNN